jgi:hypothetical protein
MNTGQMMLATGAMILLGTTVLTVNKNNLNQGTILRQTELGIYAISLATSYIQKAKSMDFDELTVAGLTVSAPMPTPTASWLTAVSKLGPDSIHLHSIVGLPFESIERRNKDYTYDDFDDYNFFKSDTTIIDVGKFHIEALVYYVNMSPPYSKTTTSPTWLKQMDIKVNNTISRNVFQDPKSTIDQGTDTIRMSYIKSFYY